MVKKTSRQAIQSNTPGVAVLQWLTYAFWGWVAIATAALIATSMNFTLNGYTSNYEGVAYVIAAVIVLLPIALACDHLFSKREQDHKVGAGAVIMVIHVVLYALLAVGALATVVFSLVSLVLSDASDVNGALVTTMTAVSVVIFLGLLVVRIVWPKVATRQRLIIRLILTVIVLAAIAWGIAGPVTQTVLRKDDDRASRAASALNTVINTYATENGELPESIDQAVSYARGGWLPDSELQFVETATSDGLVSYKPNVEEPEISTVAEDNSTQINSFYEICTTYKYDDPNRNQWSGYSMPDERGYSQSLKVSTEAGESCAQLRHTYYEN